MASDADGGGEPEAGTSLEAPERPLVVFCRKCNTILGDTNTFVCTHPALKTITLGAAYSVTSKKDEVETPPEGEARGSSFYRFYCESCSQCVGKVFLSTTKGLDPMRDNYTFDSHAIRSYELSERPQTTVENGSGTPNSSVLLDRLEVLETQLLKVENLMLLFNERIDALESGRGIKR